MLIVFGGLPGTGKTTIARVLAAKLVATYLRIDAIEQALRSADVLRTDVGPSGYAVAQTIAEANLGGSRIVVADCVNPVQASRDGWRAVARRAGARLVEVEIVCSDRQEHERRVRARKQDIPGFVLPSWESVGCVEYQPWDRPNLVLDTAEMSAPEAVAHLVQVLS